MILDVCIWKDISRTLELWWGNTRKNLLHTNTESKESKETQENKDKQILAIYFSYGEECKRVELKDIEQNLKAKYSQDVNLHIITQGYNNGEECERLQEDSIKQI